MVDGIPHQSRSIYIDGYNLYYGCLRKIAFKWLDVLGLFEPQIPPTIRYRSTAHGEPVTLPLHPDRAI
ncbi:hypothetical protein QO004_005964 [Rhizobium mesoamericanum]|uniref:hypothetical protein n=1 Tax=Rhizobium mesoamericanum TaxID=1079800 RepID=UPI00277F1548|nr:hypothetical protein [Rhizobium mesoamericanum]MDQ0564146.1 hypothetical protein [Rhizobium mesoamericanum]